MYHVRGENMRKKIDCCKKVILQLVEFLKLVSSLADRAVGLTQFIQHNTELAWA